MTLSTLRADWKFWALVVAAALALWIWSHDSGSM